MIHVQRYFQSLWLGVLLLGGCIDIEAMQQETKEIGSKIKSANDRPSQTDNSDSAVPPLPYFVNKTTRVSIHTENGVFPVKLPSSEGVSGRPPRVIETSARVGSHDIIVITDNFVVQSVLMDGKKLPEKR